MNVSILSAKLNAESTLTEQPGMKDSAFISGTINCLGNKAGSYDIIVGWDYDSVSNYMEFGETEPAEYIP